MFLNVVSTDHIEYHIDAPVVSDLVNHGNEILLPIVNHSIGTESRDLVALLIAARGSDHSGTPELRHLHSNTPDPAGSALN